MTTGSRPFKRCRRWLAMAIPFTAVGVLLQNRGEVMLPAAAAYAPNHFLGTCLDEAWVAKVEAEYSISASDRDAQGRRKHPYLHAALQAQRFPIVDPRTAKPISELYQSDCMPVGSVFYGVGAQLDADGNVVDPGRVNQTLVVELKGWASILLTTMVFSIIAQELFGYEISFFRTTDPKRMAERMSSVGTGTCAPVHANLEVWVDDELKKLYYPYASDSYSAGSIGYVGWSGLYTTVDFIQDGLNESKFSPTFGADFWRDYTDNENLITSLPVSALTNNSKYYPPQEAACADGSLGCLDSCSKTAACTEREAQGKECMVVAMMYDYYDAGYTQAVFANNGIPAYFCFLGYEGMQTYAVDAQKNGTPVVFYHYEPDPLHAQYPGLFERIILPRSTPERSRLSTGTFGEHGYGNKTDNPVRVDFPFTTLGKYASSLIQDHKPIESLVSRMSLNELQIDQLIAEYVSVSEAQPLPEDLEFAAACSWLKENYPVWSLWLGRLPSCVFTVHVAYDFVGCDPATSTVFPRQVIFKWKVPDPDNSALPHNCDGGMTKLPDPLITSRTCEWLEENLLIWAFWTRAKPVCDSTFYTYNVSDCDRPGSKREVQYYWSIESPANASLSAECTGGVELPAPVLLDCGYIPHTNAGFLAIVVIASVLSLTLFLAILFVFRYRQAPIIKRSQYQFLETMLLGGVLVCGSICGYAGKPTEFLCKFRPVGIAFGFTLVFGALVVKSLRVYRVFMSGAMKRVVLSTYTMFKILGGFLLVDVLIFVAWEAITPSLPTTTMEKTAAIGGDLVAQVQCTTSSFIFTGLLIFWKAVLLFAGLYLSFLIRKVSSDFQESVWIFASACVVLFTSLILLPLAYLVDLPATTFYLFFSILLLISTATVMGLMIIPKVLRLHEEANDTKRSTTAGGDTTSSGNNTSSGSTTTGKANGGGPKHLLPSLRASGHSKRKSSKVQSTPVQQFVVNDS